VPLLKEPTAVHAVASVHDTPNRLLSNVPATSGNVPDQLEPSQCSAQVAYSQGVAKRETFWPTAKQSEVDEHDTAFNTKSIVLKAGIVDWIVQRGWMIPPKVRPSQNSARSWRLLVLPLSE
jgi:hypothetical protein